MASVPSSRPQLSVEDIQKIVNHRKPKGKFCIVGIRGYYLDSMGAPAKNDRAIYDDAVLIVDNIHRPAYEWHVFRFNANTDPGAFRTGIANLKEGNWKYKIGIHGLSKPKPRQYKALVQADVVTVVRDGGKVESGWFGINIHKGSHNSVSSEGCQTVHPGQWEEFLSKVEGLMERHGARVVDYVLIAEKDRRAYLG